jgi:uncharacterized protein (DUF1015 family)
VRPRHLHEDAALPDSPPFLEPFAALRATAARAAEVAAPPYDVVTTEEARALARGRRWSFLHVSRPEIGFPPGADPKSPDVYAAAGRQMRDMIAAGVLVRDRRPGYYAWRLTAGGHTQTGVVAAGSVAAYEAGRIRRHEAVRAEKVEDRTRQIEAVSGHTGPVLAAHRADEAIASLLAAATAREPACAAVAADGVEHALWAIDDAGEVAAVRAALARTPVVYIADGHHRAAAAAAVARCHRAVAAGSPYAFMLVVSFPHDQLRVLPYQRIVRDLAGRPAAGLLSAIAAEFAVHASDQPVATVRPGHFGLYLGGRWYRLEPRRPAAGNRRARLDVSVLAERLLAPVFGIGDPATDARLDYLGGSRGVEALVAAVDRGEAAAAFTLAPTPIADVFAVADAGEVMPPKSTWFDPKLADGLISYPFF